MKYPKLLLLAVLFVTLRADAQKFSGGLLFGPAITDVAGFSSAYNAGGEFKKFGMYTGILVNYFISPRSELQMEFDYVQRGSQVPPDTTNNNNYYTLKLRYVDVNLIYRHHMHLSISKKPTDRLGLELGLTYSNLISYDFELKSIDYPLVLNNSCFGGLVGLFYDITPRFCFGGRYENSFTPVVPHDGTLPGLYSLFYRTWNAGNNMTFVLYFSYSFGKSDYRASLQSPPPASTAPGSGN